MSVSTNLVRIGIATSDGSPVNFATLVPNNKQRDLGPAAEYYDINASPRQFWMVSKDFSGFEQTGGIFQQSSTITGNVTLFNAMNGGRYTVTANAQITVPAVGATDGAGNAFKAHFDCEFFIASGITVTFVPGSGAVSFNYAASGNAVRTQSGTTNIICSLASRPDVTDSYFLSGS